MKITQRGFNYIGLTLVFFAIIMGVLIFPLKLPKTENKPPSGGEANCAPEDYRKPNAPALYAPDYSFGGADELDINLGGDVTYRRLKRNVLIPKSSFIIKDTGQPHHWLSGPTVTSNEGKNYTVYYPNNVAEVTDESGAKVSRKGYSYDFEAPDGQAMKLNLAAHGIIAAVHLGENGSPIEADGYNNNPDDQILFWFADIYWNPSKLELPEEVLTCKNFSSGATVGMVLNRPHPILQASSSASADGSVSEGSVVLVPPQEKSDKGDQLQLEWFEFTTVSGFRNAWWTPHCKPAVYLYPEVKTEVNVKVAPLGHFTFTDPIYNPETGWDTLAYPDGQITAYGKNYDYLYYEAAIRDGEIEKPEKGYVVKYEALPQFLSKILPQVGLNAKETADFKEYWEKTLPEQNYYFIGLVNRDNLDHIEPLEVSPKPDSVLRISLYFEGLDEFKVVLPPDVSGFERKGFSVVEWGGLVKLHKDTPFTCSQ